MPVETTAYVAVGSNLGDRAAQSGKPSTGTRAHENA